MHVLHVNFADPNGSTGRMVGTLADATERSGHSVQLAGRQGGTVDQRFVPVSLPQTQWQRTLFKKQAKLGISDFFSAALVNLINHSAFDRADIVHLHWMDGSYFSYLLLPFLTAKPTVWTFHDPAAFTGGCRYTGACQEWRENWCASCPMDGDGKGRTLRRDLVQILKAAIYKIAAFTAVCPSGCLHGQTKASILKDRDARLIYHGVDTGIYRPGNRAQARACLGLPGEGPIVLHIAGGESGAGRDDGEYLREALRKAAANGSPPFLLDLGAVGKSADFSVPTLRRPLPGDSGILAEYYRAADLFVADTVTDGFDLAAAEAMACGLPVVASAGGGISEIVVHRQTGYLAADGDSDDLARGIAGYLADEEARRRAGTMGRTRITENFAAGSMIDAYLSLYRELLLAGGGRGVMVWVKDNLPQLAAQARSTGWQEIWDKFGELYARFDREEGSVRAEFTDRYLGMCLEHADGAAETVWDIVGLWCAHRRLPSHCGGMAAGEEEALLVFCRFLREKIGAYFARNSPDRLAAIDQREQLMLLCVWKRVFFDYSSILNLHGDPGEALARQDAAAGGEGPADYGRLLAASMYHPFAADDYPLAAEDIRDAPLPLFVRMIFAYWLANTPYFNLEERHRQKLLRCLPVLCRMDLPPAYFTHFVTEILNDLWRVSYIGGDNLAALSAFGNFITRHMERFFPRHAFAAAPQAGARNGRLRVGYISRLFYQQAVSFYMVNRVIHHDRDKFEIHTFALGDRQDGMTDLFREHSDRFRRLAEIHDIGNIATVIAESRLDILIFTDIGMDPMTYMLAGLRLAPVQCALVGHGTTTGMPKIDYYISGDFEPPDADAHYREKLIRLPNLGAAQYPPPFAGNIGRCRREWNLPEDVVVFVSCANGLKHVPARDGVLVQILQEAPNACIVLKPYFSTEEGDVFTRRVMGKAEKAGVAERLFIIPPLGRVEAALAVADVQLDTYPYGGWTTNMEALYMGLPIVTQEGPMARSRWGAHMLRALGISEGIAGDAREYVDWAVRFAADTDLRLRVKSAIGQKAKAVLFDGAAAQPAYEAALMRICGRGGGNI